jgi:uncharacterized YigZ family protein
MSLLRKSPVIDILTVVTLNAQSSVSDEYFTIQKQAGIELRIQASRFLATTAQVSTRDAAEEFIDGLRRKYYDATHNCFAYRCGVEGTQFRSSDDGEPSGSAGKPILAAIDRAQLTDVCVVVTRYFGGTKLGVGGLVRAYGESAARGLEASGRQQKFIVEGIPICFPHALISNVMHVVSTSGARIADTRYADDVHLLLEIRRSKADALRARLIDHSSGKVRFDP